MSFKEYFYNRFLTEWYVPGLQSFLLYKNGDLKKVDHDKSHIEQYFYNKGVKDDSWIDNVGDEEMKLDKCFAVIIDSDYGGDGAIFVRALSKSYITNSQRLTLSKLKEQKNLKIIFDPHYHA